MASVQIAGPVTHAGFSENIHLEDPSEYRPEYAEIDAPCPSVLAATGKPIEEFRNYTSDCAYAERVKRTYAAMHTKQCVATVQEKTKHWTTFDKKKMTIMDALNLLNTLVDASDPDNDLPNIVHAFQTAERIRATWPQHDWFHLTGLIHDLGKVMAVWGEEQEYVVGDTFPVGCEFGKSIVFREDTFENNPDLHNEAYNTKYGMYKEGGHGLSNVTMSWGHDEYLYRVLQNHGATIPVQGLYAIRFHSFYPWHTGGDYMHLCDQADMKMLPWVLEFNKFDLYSKGDELPDIPKLIPYYQSLIDKYIPGVVNW